MVCKLCPVRRHCWDKGNCQDCEWGKAYEKLGRKIRRLEGENKAIKEGASEKREGEWLPDYETFIDASGRESQPIIIGWRCSLCGTFECGERLFCPDCGARMRRADNEKT